MLSCKFTYVDYSYSQDNLDLQSEVLIKSLLNPIKDVLNDTLMRGLNGRGSKQAEELLHAQITHWFEAMPALKQITAQLEFVDNVTLHVLIQRPTEERGILFSKIDTVGIWESETLFTPHASFQDLFETVLADETIAEINQRPIVGRSWENILTNATAILKYGL